VQLFHALDKRNSMFAIAVRDAFDSSGRVYQEYKRHPYSGDEVLTEEALTSLVWGWGVPWCKQQYNRFMGMLARQGRSKIQFPELDVDLLPRPTEAVQWMKKIPLLRRLVHRDEQGHVQQLTQAMIDRYYRLDETLKATHPARYAQDMARKAHLESLLQPGGEALRDVYRFNKLRQLVVCALLPIVALTFGVTSFNQWRTRTRQQLAKIRDQRRAKRAEGLDSGPLRHAASASSANGVSSQIPNRAAGAMAFAAFGVSASRLAPPPEQLLPAMRFGGLAGQLGKSLSPAVSHLLENETLHTALFMDVPLSSGRIYMASRRNRQDMLEKLIKESTLIAVIFYGQRWIQDQMNAAMDKLTKSVTDVEFKALAHLHRHYGQTPSGAQALREALQKSFQHLGITPGQAWHQTARADAVADKIRDYIHTKYQQPGLHQPNLLLDLAEMCEKIPVLQSKNVVTGKVAPQTIDITQKIQLGDIEHMAHKLDTVARYLQQRPNETLKHILQRTTGSKYFSFTVSALLCWLVVSNLMPKLQHFVTYLQTGIPNYFPGLDTYGKPDSVETTSPA
jgi:hypothetical protein